MELIQLLDKWGWKGLVVYFLVKEAIPLYKKWQGDYVSYKMIANNQQEIKMQFTVFREIYDKHVQDDQEMRLTMEKFFSGQTQLNDNFKQMIERHEFNNQKLFDLITDIKNYLLERK